MLGFYSRLVRLKPAAGDELRYSDLREFLFQIGAIKTVHKASGSAADIIVSIPDWCD